jgi:hypothetical protein
MKRKIVNFILLILTIMSVSIALNLFMLLELNEEGDKYNAKITHKNIELKVLTNQFNKLQKPSEDTINKSQKASDQFNELQRASEDTIDNLLSSIEAFNERIDIISALNNNYREKLTKLCTPIWLGAKESESFKAVCDDFGMAITDCSGRTLFDIVTNSNAAGNANGNYADNYNLFLCPH